MNGNGNNKRRKLRDAAKRINQSTNTRADDSSDRVRTTIGAQSSERSNASTTSEQIGSGGTVSANISGTISESTSAAGSIVDGIGNGGERRRKRRSDAGKPRTRTSTGNSANAAEASAEQIGAIPIRRRRLTKKSLEESKAEKAAVLGLIAVGCNAIYGTAALFLGGHWELERDETVALSKAVDNALSTLPQEYYGLIRQAIENYVPWIALCITAGAITIPRWQQSFGTNRNNASETANAGNVQQVDFGDGIPGSRYRRDYTNGIIESDGSTDS
jgi:hypothetical protein